MSVILERNSSGATTTSYLRNPLAPGGIGGIISSTTATQNYYHYDGIGTVTVLSNASGVSTQTYTYDAFGNTLAQTGTATNNRNFLTKQTDSTGLVFFGARYYDPKIGRFISKDPSGMTDGPNIYTYCNNDPVNYVDLWGLSKADAAKQAEKDLWNKSLADLWTEWVNNLKNPKPITEAELNEIIMNVVIGASGGIKFVPGKIVIGETASRVAAKAAKLVLNIIFLVILLQKLV